jgi:pimeloyl-ACP methyl ester carboxylesterase
MTAVLNHVVHRRDSAGPALLLIHPLGGDLTFWDECIAYWPSLACIACDLRSAGDSPRPAAPLSPAEHARDLEALRRTLGIACVVPVGCAIGGMIAAAYAAGYPDAVRGVVLSNPALRTSEAARAMLADRAAAVRKGGMEAILPGAVDRAFLEQPRDERYRRYYARFAQQDPEAYALSALAVLDADASDDLKAVRCPALVVAGGHDVLLPPEQSRAVHALIADAQFHLLADAAHFAPLQQPRAFAELVLDFVRHVESAPESRRAATTGAVR